MPQNPLVTHIVEATTGGVARQLDWLAQTLPSRGFDLQFIVSCQRDPSFEQNIAVYREQGVRVDVVPMGRALNPLKDTLSLTRLHKILGRDRPAVVHTHASKAGFLGRRAAYSLEIPAIIHTPHVFAFEWQESLPSSLYRFLEHQAAKWCDRLVLLSDLQLECTLASGIAPLEKLCVIPNGIAAEAYPPPTAAERESARQKFSCPEDSFVIGMAARFAPQKGLGDFLRAARAVVAARPEITFLLAGEGALREEFVARVQDLGLSKRIRFCGRVDEMLPFYHALDGFVLASLWEGLPYVILEAQATGLPVVASGTAGAAAIIENNETGLLVPIGDEAALAAGILRLFTDADFRARIAAWGQARVRELFRLDPWADSLAELYVTTLEQARE